jgi:hypothetical protein
MKHNLHMTRLARSVRAVAMSTTGGGAALALALAALPGQTVLAQADVVEQVVVTGSRIIRQDMVANCWTTTPVSVSKQR